MGQFPYKLNTTPRIRNEDTIYLLENDLSGSSMFFRCSQGTPLSSKPKAPLPLQKGVILSRKKRTIPKESDEVDFTVLFQTI
jgi:hypothetical protein